MLAIAQRAFARGRGGRVRNGRGLMISEMVKCRRKREWRTNGGRGLLSMAARTSTRLYGQIITIWIITLAGRFVVAILFAVVVIQNRCTRECSNRGTRYVISTSI